MFFDGIKENQNNENQNNENQLIKVKEENQIINN